MFRPAECQCDDKREQNVSYCSLSKSGQWTQNGVLTQLGLNSCCHLPHLASLKLTISMIITEVTSLSERSKLVDFITILMNEMF